MAYDYRKIEELKKEKGLSFSQIAKACGVVKSTVASWSTGKTKPDGRYMASLEKVLGVKPGEWGGSALTLDLTELTPEQRIKILDQYALLKAENDGTAREIGTFEVDEGETLTYEIVDLDEQ